MKRPIIGTLAWAELTQGTLRRRDRWEQILTVLGIRLDRMARRVASREKTAGARVDPDAIVLPDSPTAVAALELLRSTSSLSLANHCLRTYFWGALFAQAGNLRPDREAFFIASLLHDLGLTEAHSFNAGAPHCFACEGAMAAEAFAIRAGWPADRARIVGDAIAQHLNVRVAPERGVEAHLVHEGASADVIGTRIDEISARHSAEVLQRFPREQFKREILAMLEPQIQRRPGSRIAFLAGNGFRRMIQRAPFEE